MINKMPLPNLHLVFRKFKGNELIDEHDEPAHSWNRNAWNLLVPMYCNPLDLSALSGWGSGVLGAKDINGNVYSNGNATIDMTTTKAGENETDRGLLLGSNSGEFDINDYTLSSSLGWNNVSAMSIKNWTDTSATPSGEMYAELTRSFLNLNEDESDILVNEVGYVLNGSIFGSQSSYLLARDVLGSTVIVSYDELLEVTYQITFDASDMLAETGLSINDEFVKHLTSSCYLACAARVPKVDLFDFGELDAFEGITNANDACFHSGSNHLFVSDSDGYIYKVDPRIGKMSAVSSIKMENGVSEIVIGPNDTYLYACVGDDVVEIDISGDMSEIRRYTGSSPSFLVAGDTNIFVIENYQLVKINLNDMTSDGVTNISWLFNSDFRGLARAIYANGYVYISAEGKNETRKVDVTDMSEVGFFQNDFAAGGEYDNAYATFNPVDGYLYIFSSHKGSHHKVDPSNMEEVEVINNGYKIRDPLVCGPTGYVYTNTRLSGFKLLDPQTGITITDGNFSTDGGPKSFVIGGVIL